MPTNYFHIYQRFSDRGVIFYDYPEHLLHLTTISTTAKRHGIKIVAMCQMPDHCHYLVKADSAEDIAFFIRVSDTFFANEYRSVLGINDKPLFECPYGRAEKKNSKSIRTAIAYVYNNPVEKALCDKAQDYRWNYLAYSTTPCPFSPKIILSKASRHLRRALKEVRECFLKAEFLRLRQLRRMFDGLSMIEREQLCDYITNLYCPIDFEAMSQYYDGIHRAILAINSNTGSEYDIIEEYNRFKDNLYGQFSKILLAEGIVSHPSDVLAMEQSKKISVASWLRWKTGAPFKQINRYLHLSDRGTHCSDNQ